MTRTMTAGGAISAGNLGNSTAGVRVQGRTRSKRASRNLFLAISAIVLAVFILVGLSAYAASIQHANNVLIEENEYLQAEIDSLNSQIVEATKITKIEEVAKALISEHALPENEATDAYHIATAAFYGMDVLLTWNCRHMANEFTLPKTYGVLRDAGLKCPVIITPKRYMEDADHDA